MIYGGAEFSRDTDLVILCDDANLDRLQAALDELQAEVIAVPPFKRRYLEMGLAVHFRCRHPDADRMRVDVMSKLRGVDAFDELWARRTTVIVESTPLNLLSLPDLVRAKKTQRDKDWVMIARLLETHYFANQNAPSSEQIVFWFRELRTPQLLIELAEREPEVCAGLTVERPLLEAAARGDEADLRAGLRTEEDREREADREYWAPLFAELQCLRRQRG